MFDCFVYFFLVFCRSFCNMMRKDFILFIYQMKKEVFVFVVDEFDIVFFEMVVFVFFDFDVNWGKIMNIV